MYVCILFYLYRTIFILFCFCHNHWQSRFFTKIKLILVFSIYFAESLKTIFAKVFCFISFFMLLLFCKINIVSNFDFRIRIPHNFSFRIPVQTFFPYSCPSENWKISSIFKRCCRHIIIRFFTKTPVIEVSKIGTKGSVNTNNRRSYPCKQENLNDINKTKITKFTNLSPKFQDWQIDE